MQPMPDPMPRRRDAPVTGYADLPVFSRFSDVLDDSTYRTVPDDWLIGLCDIVGSTKAIEAGRYKAVNFAGAAAIVAVRNALGGADVPFVFGGDGASFLIAPADAAAAEDALGRCVTWTREDLDLDLRAGLVPVRAVRAAGYDVRAARYAASPDVTYGMFTGGGFAYADRALKEGRHGIRAAPPGAKPDLAGLSCRFDETPVTDGTVLSLIVVPNASADPAAVMRTIGEILALIEAGPGMGRPLPASGPRLHWPPAGLGLEARAARRPGEAVLLRQAVLLVRTLVSFLIFKLGLDVGRFSPKAYIGQLVANADFRKYDDGLRMTVACTHATADAIAERLAAAGTAGLLRHGLHRQSSAVVTCLTPSPLARDHVHFVDGVGGGYAHAALQLKRGPS